MQLPFYMYSRLFGMCSRTSKGFSGQQTVKLNGCTEVYVETLRVFLHALNVPVQRPTLHQGVRQFLHRMVVCLDTDILPFIPVAMHSLLELADVRELYDFIPFVNQVIQKFKVRFLDCVEAIPLRRGEYLRFAFTVVFHIVYLLLTMR